MDPPSYGRGPGGEIWKLEEQVFGWWSFACRFSAKTRCFLLNKLHHRSFSRREQYLLGTLLVPRFGGSLSAEEIGLPVTSTGMALPCGSTAIWQK